MRDGSEVQDMQVRGVDHINIVAEDLEQTVEFYERVLGMRAAPIPLSPKGFKGHWIYDHKDQAIIHIQAYNPQRHKAPDERGKLTGALDHIALNCCGFESIVNRCEELGVDVQINDRQHGDLRQVFLMDPNHIRIELNFSDD